MEMCPGEGTNLTARSFVALEEGAFAPQCTVPVSSLQDVCGNPRSGCLILRPPDRATLWRHNCWAHTDQEAKEWAGLTKRSFKRRKDEKIARRWRKLTKLTTQKDPREKRELVGTKSWRTEDRRVANEETQRRSTRGEVSTTTTRRRVPTTT